ncbi:nickel-type superoxide dismutase maturation protease [Streptomyces tsukubensis]|nr:nickel-type superoxide dismutase maturation protease [Streptomyces tsukubensis]
MRVPLGIAEVHGPSMVPTLRHGDQLLVRYGARVRAGDVVVLRHPFQQDLLVVKRAVERRDGGWWVLGDNPYAGGDSTDYGAVPEDLILARVLGRYRPRNRATTVPAQAQASAPDDAPAVAEVPSDRVVAAPGAAAAAGRTRGFLSGQRSAVELVSWAFSAVRPVLADRSLSKRLRAR